MCAISYYIKLYCTWLGIASVHNFEKRILECNLLCGLLMCYFQNANYTLNRLSKGTKLVYIWSYIQYKYNKQQFTVFGVILAILFYNY